MRRYVQCKWMNALYLCISVMAIRVVEFSNGGYKIKRFFTKNQHTPQWCVLTNSSPLGVGQAPVENSWGTYKTKNVAQKS